jgi:acylphosphatase
VIRRRLVITGKVQGVFYRAWFVGKAESLGLAGWVRNRADGSVEAVIEGTPEQVEAGIDRARRGSPASRVEDVEVRDDAPAESLDGFVTRPSV